MPTIKIIDRSGAEHEFLADRGLTLMEALRDQGVDELLALCGGCCSCATCHVYIETGEKSISEGIGEDENELLDTSSHRIPNSRLSCQIKLETIDSLTVRVAPED